VCGGLATRGHESARLAPPVARRDPFGQATVAGAGIMEPMADSPSAAPPSWPPPDPRQLVPERSSKRRSVDVSWVVGDLRRRRAQLVVGVLAECVAWWAFRVPWDMSEVNRQGQIIERHGDQTMLRLVAALAVLTVAYLVAATVTGRMETVALAVGSAAAWAFIWSWRASASRGRR